MTKRVQLLRHTQLVGQNFIGRVGEVTVDVTVNALRVHDGLTKGGTSQARGDLANVAAATSAVDGKMTAALVQAIAANTALISSNQARYEDFVSIGMTDGNSQRVITDAEFAHGVMFFEGSIDQNITVVLPNTSGRKIIKHNIAGDFTITIKCTNQLVDASTIRYGQIEDIFVSEVSTNNWRAMAQLISGNSIQAFYDAINWVGKVEVTLVDTPPGVPIGVVATWEKVAAGKFIKSVTSSPGTTGGNASVNSSDAGGHDHGGDTEDHQLTISQLPEHRFFVANSQSSNNSVLPSHSVTQAGTAPGDSAYDLKGSSAEADRGRTNVVGSDQAHSHGIIAESAHHHSVSIDPPWIKMILWQRIA